MARIAYIAHVKHGKEPECRELLQVHTPVGGLKRLDVHGLEVFIGSGYCIMVLEHQAQDPQTFLQRFSNDKGMRGFLNRLRPFVEGLPKPGEAYAPGDSEHTGSPAPAASAMVATITSADLPLADSAYRWIAGTPGSASEGQ